MRRDVAFVEFSRRHCNVERTNAVSRMSLIRAWNAAATRFSREVSDCSRQGKRKLAQGANGIGRTIFFAAGHELFCVFSTSRSSRRVRRFGRGSSLSRCNRSAQPRNENGDGSITGGLPAAMAARLKPNRVTEFAMTPHLPPDGEWSAVNGREIGAGIKPYGLQHDLRSQGTIAFRLPRSPRRSLPWAESPSPGNVDSTQARCGTHRSLRLNFQLPFLTAAVCTGETQAQRIVMIENRLQGLVTRRHA